MRPTLAITHNRPVGDVTALGTKLRRISVAAPKTSNHNPGVSIRSLVQCSRGFIYDRLPQKLKVLTSELVFKYSNRPHVYHNDELHPSRGLQRGVVTFSIDFELAWGWAYAKGMSRDDAVAIGLRERLQVPMILQKMDEYGIPATWATVGHLFLDKCERNANGFAHTDVAHLHHFVNEFWEFSSGDWFQVDPCTDYQTDPAWYAPDLVEMILHSKVAHEIGSHSFSHGGFGDYCSPEIAESKIEACIRAMKRFGIRPKTWVFPGNDTGNFESLAKKGFRSVRSFPEKKAEISLPIKRDDGMWDIHESTPIDLEGSGWDFIERLERLKKFVDKAAETKMCAHIWFHPSLLPDQMNELLFPLLKYCSELRTKGAIDVLTIDQLVDATEAALKKEGKL